MDFNDELSQEDNQQHQNRFIFSNDYYEDMPLEDDNRLDVARKVEPFISNSSSSGSNIPIHQTNDMDQLVQNEYSDTNTFDFFGHDANTKIPDTKPDEVKVDSVPEEDVELEKPVEPKKSTYQEDSFFSALGNSIIKKRPVVDENVVHLDKPEVKEDPLNIGRVPEMPEYHDFTPQADISQDVDQSSDIPVEKVDTTGVDNSIIDNIVDYQSKIPEAVNDTNSQYIIGGDTQPKEEKTAITNFMDQNQKASNLSIETGVNQELEQQLIKQRELEEEERRKNNPDLQDYLRYTPKENEMETLYRAGGKSITREKKNKVPTISPIFEKKLVNQEPVVQNQPQVVNIDEEIKNKPQNIDEMIEDILNVPNLSNMVVPINQAENPGVSFGSMEPVEKKDEVKEGEPTTVYDEKKDNFDYDQNFDNVVVKKSDLLDKLKEQADKDGRISILARYGEDFCSRDYVTNPAIGRAEEIKQLILILLTPEKSGILIGKPGIGKTSIVEGLAYQLQRDNVPDALKGYVIVSVKTASLLGTLPTGETRLQTLVDELKQLDKIILFIDEVHMLIGATNDSALDFANMFKESLGRGSIKVIGATTTEEYERYILRDKAFVRRFQKVEVQEPNREQTIKILIGTLPKIEKSTGAKLKYTQFIQSEIMAFIVDITTEYKRIYGIGSRYPDICLTLLAQAFSQAVFANRKEVTIIDIRRAIENSKNIYPDVIKKELVNFDKKFKDIIQEEESQK